MGVLDVVYKTVVGLLALTVAVCVPVFVAVFLSYLWEGSGWRALVYFCGRLVLLAAGLVVCYRVGLLLVGGL